MQTKFDLKDASSISQFGLGKADLEEGVELLVGLGLTERQARVYLALLRIGAARVRAIADAAQFSRQEVYSLLAGLHQMGLVQQSFTVPINYTAIPIAEAIKLLLKQKTTQLTLISQKAKEVAKKFDFYSSHMSLESKPSFGMICGVDRGKRYKKALEETQHTLEVVTGWLSFKQLCFRFETLFQEALKRGIIIRIIVERPLNHQLPRWVEMALLEHSNFTLKTIPYTPAAAITLFDRSQAAIAHSSHPGFNAVPVLWTTHSALIAVCQAYFNALCE